jgi:nucleoside-diphosphate-sugar epimerase
MAQAAFTALVYALKVVTGGRMSVLSSGSLDFLTRDNPFTSERARKELGWTPTVRPERGVPEAFRWWLKSVS